MRIEKATVELAEAVIALDAAQMGNDARRAFLTHATTAGECYVAIVDTKVAGFAIFDQSFFRQPFIDLLLVAPEYRRQGIGAALMRYIATICPSPKLFTSTNRSNIPMQRLCEMLGYTQAGYIEHLDEGDPEIIFFKRLDVNAEE